MYLKEVNSLGDMENASNKSDGQHRHGFGDLGTNLEFLMLKVAQMETAARPGKYPSVMSSNTFNFVFSWPLLLRLCFLAGFFCVSCLRLVGLCFVDRP